jgi:hypothetical protein
LEPGHRLGPEFYAGEVGAATVAVLIHHREAERQIFCRVQTQAFHRLVSATTRFFFMVLAIWLVQCANFDDVRIVCGTPQWGICE